MIQVTQDITFVFIYLIILTMKLRFHWVVK